MPKSPSRDSGPESKTTTPSRSSSPPRVLFRSESTVFHAWSTGLLSPVPPLFSSGFSPTDPLAYHHASRDPGPELILVAFDEVGRGCLAGPVVAGCTLWVPGKVDSAFERLLGRVDDSKRLTGPRREGLYEAFRGSLPFLCQEPLVANPVSIRSPEASPPPLAVETFHRSLIRHMSEGQLVPASRGPHDFDSLRSTGRRRSFRCLGAGVGHASSEEIDSHNIWRAVQLAMARAFHHAMGAAGLPVPETPGEDAPPFVLLVDGKLGIHVSPGLSSSPQVVAVQGDGRFASIGLASILAKVARDRFMTRLAEEFPQFGFERHKGYGTAEHLTALLGSPPSPFHRKTFLRGLA